jgi:hypothetical protein
VAETLKSFKFFIVGSKQTDEERDIGLLFVLLPKYPDLSLN